MTSFTTKDSGKRQEYDSGMRRDTADGKPRFDLIIPADTAYSEENVKLYKSVFVTLAGIQVWSQAQDMALDTVLTWYLGGPVDATGIIRRLVNAERLDNVYEGSLLKRYGELLARGAEKYDARNWEKASGLEELERFKSSALRHFMQWLLGEIDEDHAAATVFNVLAADWLTHKLKENQ